MLSINSNESTLRLKIGTEHSKLHFGTTDETKSKTLEKN